MQFGSDYARLRDFKASFLGELKKVSKVYAGAQFEPGEVGLVVKPRPPHITRKPA